MATGRSDFPNQVNNVLGFPYIFRGALDVSAIAINEEMKIAAVRALADLAKEDVPDSVLRAYGKDMLEYGPNYIIPKPFDPRVLIRDVSFDREREESPRDLFGECCGRRRPTAANSRREPSPMRMAIRSGSSRPSRQSHRFRQLTAAGKSLAWYVSLHLGTDRRGGWNGEALRNLRGAARVDLGSRLRLGTAEALDRGSLVHAWFEQIEWIEEGVPSEETLQAIARRMLIRGLNIPQQIEQFHKSLTQPMIRTCEPAPPTRSPGAAGKPPRFTPGPRSSNRGGRSGGSGPLRFATVSGS